MWSAVVVLTAGAGPGPLNKIGQQFQNNILDVRKVLESPLERKAKSLAFTGGIAATAVCQFCGERD